MDINGKYLLELGFPQGKAIGTALAIIDVHYPSSSPAELTEILASLLNDPARYLDDPVWAPVAVELTAVKGPVQLIENPPYYKIYGKQDIEAGALQQMDLAMRLPLTRAGALMPDAHQGYGLPIGGVLATENAVIPFGVGVDIGCRMCMTVYPLPESLLTERHKDFKRMLNDHTRFGRAEFEKPEDHEVMYKSEFLEIPIVKSFRDRAFRQLGTSGGGNHFVEFGVVEINDRNQVNPLPEGTYLAVLSHSGSRGLGAGIARYYTQVAMEKSDLPRHARQLAWLDLNSQEGQEYWRAMNLAGEYASACHHQIHHRLGKALGERPLVMIENHHNFAWKEKDEHGAEIIVHRKGATPASLGTLGIIPGSMTSPGFIVRGKGDPASINSASHGAGRLMSRTQAKKVLNKKDVDSFLKRSGVDVIGSGLDEAPMVYKDILRVMEYQKDLVDKAGVFTPRIIRMCGDERFHEVD